MAREITLPRTSEEDALGRIVTFLREAVAGTRATNSPIPRIDLYLIDVINASFTEAQQQDLQRNPPSSAYGMVSYNFNPSKNSESFYAAAWNLCRRGILYPSVIHPDESRNVSTFAPAAFSLTEYGKRWIQQSSQFDVLPSEYGRFAQRLAQHDNHFGPGYHARSQEAIGCYQSHNYLACCTMCGAASESILLRLAIEAEGDEQVVLSMYRSSNGRQRIQTKLLGQATERIRLQFQTYTPLLNYWRDDAAHGAATNLTENDAFLALILLLGFANFADTTWDELTQQH